MGIGRFFPDSRPALDLNFARTKRLDPRISYSRASAGTYGGSDGLIKSAATNEARFDHSPATGGSLGLLVEEARTNRVGYSATPFDSWTKTGCQVLPIYGEQVAPDGTSICRLIQENTSTGAHQLSTSFDNDSSLKSYTLFVKPKNRTRFQLVLSTTNAAAATFNLTTLSIQYQANAGNGYIIPLSNGWYRVGVSHTSASDNRGYPEIKLLDNNGASSYAGDGSSGIYVWGFQYEFGSFFTSYIPTPATFTSRASSATFYNVSGVVQTVSSGVARNNTFFPDGNGIMRSAGLLLEPAASNLLIYSQEFNNSAWSKTGATVLADVILAPDLTATADKFTSTSGESLIAIQQSVSVTPGSGYTASVFAKAAEINVLNLQLQGTAQGNVFVTANLTTGAISDKGTIQKLANDWYRISKSFTQGSGNTINLVLALPSGTSPGSGIYVWGAQLELGNFASSYILTSGATATRAADSSTSATVTRSADVAVISGASFNEWYNQSEGTILAQYSVPSAGVNGIASFNDNSSSERIEVFASGVDPKALVVDGNSTQVDLDGGTIAGGVIVKTAVAYALNDFAVSHANGNVVIDSGGTLPTVDRLFIGSNQASNRQNGAMRRFSYWPNRLSNAILRGMTL